MCMTLVKCICFGSFARSCWLLQCPSLGFDGGAFVRVPSYTFQMEGGDGFLCQPSLPKWNNGGWWVMWRWRNCTLK